MALAVDTANKSNSGIELDSDILEWSHTVAAGSNRVLIVVVFWKGPVGFVIPAIDQVVFGAADLTSVGNGAHNVSGSDDIWSQAYYLVNPSVSTADIAIFFGDGSVNFIGAYAGAFVVTDAEQTSSVVRGAAVNATWDNNPRITIPSSTEELIVDVFCVNNPPGATAGAGQTQLFNAGSAGIFGGASSFQTGGAGLMDWALTTSQMWCTFAFVVTRTGILTTKAVTDSCKVVATEVASKDATVVTTPWSAVSTILGTDLVPVQVNTLRISRTIGAPATASFSLVNPDHEPRLGDPVIIRWMSASGGIWQIFNGNVDRLTYKTNNRGTFVTYDVEMVDKGHMLQRIMVLSVDWALSGFTFQVVVSTIIHNHLYAFGDFYWYIAYQDHASTIIPNVTAKLGTSIYELLHDVAAAVGCMFYTDAYGMWFVDEGATTAPMTFSEDTIEEASITQDRDDYRNVQFCKATGTSSSAASTDPVIDYKQAYNDPQIYERRAIEGAGVSGRYENYEEVTHPTSNDQATISLLAQSVTKILLRTAGAGFQRRLSIRVRDTTGAGIQAGQLTTIELLRMGVSNAVWVVQSVDIEDEDGRFLLANVELTETTNVRRKLDSWLRIVQKGQVAITAPDQAVNQGQLFTASGTFVVPAGVTTVLITCFGSGGGGGGAVNVFGSAGIQSPPNYHADGGYGGTGGIAFALRAVTPAESLTVTIGNGGIAGSTGSIQVNLGFLMTSHIVAGVGGVGGTSQVTRGAAVLCSAFGGGGGGPGTVTLKVPTAEYIHTDYGALGASGGGGGDGVTIGGGIPGGRGGIWGRPTGTGPVAGPKGQILIQWFA
jgi:hypothetical protein